VYLVFVELEPCAFLSVWSAKDFRLGFHGPRCVDVIGERAEQAARRVLVSTLLERSLLVARRVSSPRNATSGYRPNCLSSRLHRITCLRSEDSINVCYRCRFPSRSCSGRRYILIFCMQPKQFFVEPLRLEASMK